MPEVTVQLNPMLADRLRRNSAPFQAEVQEGSPVSSLLVALRIRLDDIALAVVNGHVARLDQELHAGDFVLVMPRVAGG